MNKKRHIYIGIIITLTMTLAITILLFSQFDNNTWREVATAFIFPFIYTIAGAIIVTAVGTIIADKVLENYNERLSYGLSKRVIQLLGYPVFSDRIEDDLHRSALMKNEIIPIDPLSLVEQTLSSFHSISTGTTADGRRSIKRLRTS